MPSLVPCNCTMCRGAKVRQSERQRHEARDRKARSLSRPTLHSQYVPPRRAPTTTFQPPANSPQTPLTSVPPAPMDVDPDPAQPVWPPTAPHWQSAGSSALKLATEAAGLEHARQVERSGEIFLPIADDDWETPELNADEDAIADQTLETAQAASPPTFDENDPDPFYFVPSGAQALPTAADIHPNRAVYLIYVTVLWLHTQFHVPFRACSALLAIFALALKAGNAPITPEIHTSLPSVINKLGAEPSIQILPVCPKCFEVYPISTPKDSNCSKCSEPLFPTEPSPSERRSGHTSAQNPRPYLQFPTKSLAEQLAILLSVPGIEDEMEKSLKKATAHQAGKYTNIFDGKICQELPTADGSRFFFPSEDEVAQGELRIGVTMGVDCIINLLAHHRYRTANLLLAGIMPGPKEANPDQCQRFLRPLISELLRLWKDGVKIVTPKYPPRPPRFAERTNARHRHLQKEYQKCTTKSARDAFVKANATRWSELHRLPYFDICQMVVIDPMHNLFLGVVKTHFYHIWVQLNVLRKTKELRSLHAILSKLKLPAHLGRLPSLIGEPAGGSLTADQWLNFATVVASLAIPQLWQEYASDETPAELSERRAQEISAVLAQKRIAAAAARQAALVIPANAPSSGKRIRNIILLMKPTAKAAAMDIDPDATNGLDAGAENDSENDQDYGRQTRRKRPKPGTDAEDEARDNASPPNLHPADPGNFLKLSTAIKILVSDEITEAQLRASDTLLRDYCQELVELYGAEVIRPNHHYATHTARCVRNYGPLREFWTFLFERLNKVLKSYKTPNHAGGELESSFFREFQRTVQQSRLLAQGAREPPGSELRQAVQIMYHATEDDRGTVQALARGLDSVNLDAGITFQLSTRAEKGKLPSDLYDSLLQHLQLRLTNLQLHSYFSIGPPGSWTLSGHAVFFDYVVIQNRRFLASSRAASSANSLVAVRTSSAPGASLWVGELLAVFAIKQDNIGTHRFGHVRWLRPSTTPIAGTVWSDFAALTVQVWHPNNYLTPADDGPEPLIELNNIVCHVVRMDVVIKGQRRWATITVGKASSVFFVSNIVP
ncbi:hypothetical protein C8R46DRAFT_1115786 [Mycena filopes]|nr:hypothetical protein C8R46DRAFT_1115786 [Mycena filopes]